MILKSNHFLATYKTDTYMISKISHFYSHLKNRYIYENNEKAAINRAGFSFEFSFE